MRKRLVAAAVGALLSIAAARGDDTLKIPRPNERLASPPPPPALDPSLVSLLVSVPVDVLTKALAEAMPAEGGEEERWLDGSRLVGKPGFQYQYRVFRGEPTLTAVGDHLEIAFTKMTYRLRGKLASAEGRCGYDDAPKPLTLRGRVALSWAPDGTLRSQTTFEPAEFSEPCQLAPLDVDATQVLKTLAQARLPEAARALDEALRSRSLSHKRIVLLWQKLQTPSEVEPRLWLTLRPAPITAAPFTAETSQSIRTALSVPVRPAAVIGPKPAAAQPALPPVRVAPVQPSGLHIALPIRVSYAELNRSVSERLVGKPIDAGALGKARITRTLLYGSGDRVILQLEVEGGVNGTIYSAGRPVFDPATAVLAMEGFDLTIDTKNILARTANAVAHGTLVSELEPSTRSDLKDRIEQLRQHLEKLLNREVIPGLKIEASDVRFTPKGVYPVAGGIEIQVVADAAARLTAD